MHIYRHMFWCGINKNGGVALKSPYSETLLCSAAGKSGEKQDDTKKKKNLGRHINLMEVQKL